MTARMLVVAQARNMDLEEVLKHELSPRPWSLASAEELLVKTMKSSLLAITEQNIPPQSMYLEILHGWLMLRLPCSLCRLHVALLWMLLDFCFVQLPAHFKWMQNRLLL